MDNYWLNKKNENKFTEDLKALNKELIIENANLKKNLAEACSKFEQEMAEAEKITYEGYEEAYQIICDLCNQLEAAGKQPVMGGSILKHFPPSNTISPSVKITDQDLSYKAPDDLETRLYAEYEAKVKQAKDFIVDKVDAFLKMEEEERNNILAGRLRKNHTAQQIVDAALEN